MVSRRQLIKDIEKKIREVETRRSELSSTISEQQRIIQESKGATREILPQRRFGRPVGQVKEAQQKVLARREQAKQNITIAESNIQQLQNEVEALNKAREKLVKERKFVEDIPEIERQRRKDIEAGRLSVRDEDTGELIPIVPEGDREMTITIQEIPAQRLVPPRAEEQDLVKMSVGQKLVEASEKSLQRIDATFFPEEAKENQNIEDSIREQQRKTDQLNYDIAVFNQEFGGRRLTETEIAQAEKRYKELDIRSAKLGFETQQLKLDLKTIKKFQVARGRYEPERFFVGGLSEITKLSVGAIPTAIVSAKAIKDIVLPKDTSKSLLGGGLTTGQLAKESEFQKNIITSFSEQPYKTTGEIVGGAVVISGGRLALKSLFPREPVKITKIKPIVTTVSKDVVIPLNKDVAFAGFKVTEKVSSGGVLVESRSLKEITRIIGKQPKGLLSYEPLYDPSKIKPIVTESGKKALVFKLTKPFERVTYLPKGTLISLKTGKILDEPIFKTIRDRGKITTGTLKGQILPKKYTATELKSLDPFTRSQILALSEAKAGVPTTTNLLKGVKFQKGFAFSEELLKLTRAGKKSLVPLGKRISRAELLTTAKELKGIQIPSVKLYKTRTAVTDVSLSKGLW